MIKTFTVNGTEYQMGYEIGKNFKEYLNQKINKYVEKLSNKEIYKNVKEMEIKLKEKFPKCLEEIYGRADGANISRDALLLMFFPEIFKKQDGCTTVVLKKKNGNILFSHNEDDKNYNIQNVALIKYQYKDYWIVGYTMAEKLTGSSFAFNSYGLVFSSNYIFDTKVDTNNVSRYIAVRDVINSKSIEEASLKLKNNKIASAFSLNILDINKNEAINIEKDIEDVYITNIEDRYVRSNHFIAKKDNLPEPPISSKFRYLKSKELINNINNEKCSINDLINILNYETEDYYKSIYKNPKKYLDKSRTVANLSVNSGTKEIIIYDYLGDFKYNIKDYFEKKKWYEF